VRKRDEPGAVIVCLALRSRFRLGYVLVGRPILFCLRAIIHGEPRMKIGEGYAPARLPRLRA
jgi:hypothetical protein